MLARLRTPAARRLGLLFAALGAAFAVVTLGLPHSPEELRAALPVSGLAAAAVCLAAWTVLTPALCGGTLLAAATGLLLGPAVGTPVAIAGAVAGGSVAFLIARRAGADALDGLGGPRLRRAQAAVERRGFTSMLCARLLPGVPTTLLHYAAGLSRVRLRDFAGAMALGGAPRIFAYTALGGSLGGDLADPLTLVALGLIAGMSILGIALAWRWRAASRSPVLAPAP